MRLKPKIVAITSAREHSKRLLNKELNVMAGKLMIEWTLDQMRDCNLFDVRLMSTDWIELINLMQEKYKTIHFIKRPKELAEDNVPTQPYITHALEGRYQVGYIYCLLQSTSPVRDMKLIYDTYKTFTDEYNSLFTVNKYTLKTDGQIYWFRDPFDMWKGPSYPYLTEPAIDIDFLSDMRIGEYFLTKKEVRE